MAAHRPALSLQRLRPRTSFGTALLYTAAIYLAFILVIPDQAFWTVDGGGKFYQLLHLQWTGTGFSDGLAYPVRDLDPEMRLVNLPYSFLPRADGLFHSWYPLFLAVVSRLPFTLLGLRGLLILPALAGVLSSLLAGRIVERWRPGRGWVALVMTAFATPVLFYSQTFWEHTIAVCLALAGLWVLLGADGEVRSSKFKVQGEGNWQLAIGNSGADAGSQKSEVRSENPRSPLGDSLRLAQGQASLDSQNDQRAGLPIPNSKFPALIRYPLAVGLIALAGVFRPEMLLFAACGLAWIAYRLFGRGIRARLGLAALALAGAAAAGVVLARSTYAGDLLRVASTLQGRLLTYGVNPAERASALPRLGQRLANAFYNVPDAGGLVSAPMLLFTMAALALAVAATLAPGGWRAWLLMLAALAISAPVAANVFYPGPVVSIHGIVLSAPIILAAGALLRSQMPARGLLAATIGAFVLAELLFFDSGTAGGREWGARGILLIYPLAAMIVAAGWPDGEEVRSQKSEVRSRSAPAQGDSLRFARGHASLDAQSDRKEHGLEQAAPRMTKVALAVLVALSAGLQLRGMGELREELGIWSSWTRALESLPPRAIVATDVWWLGSVSTPVWREHRFVVLPDDETQAGNAQYLASQPLARTAPLAWATTCMQDCSLPANLQPYFRAESAQQIRGLWLATLTPQG